jgi:hypothetical protein
VLRTPWLVSSKRSDIDKETSRSRTTERHAEQGAVSLQVSPHVRPCGALASDESPEALLVVHERFLAKDASLERNGT